ncbi:hypothetical protein [Myceligenerans xiligouense]|uniref:SUKH superfamily protein n=1 Tax=Myceligenerans xiligouense TaxID=253184 RepID=A0A3N4ZB24_9MICO|nr:hypothetical protein [Myceligenerans xiligouense]RPF23068.1 hypothetical protein EDD34_3748 [Myceligenerans xiligouense]
MMLQENLARLKEVLRSAGRPVVDALLPGIEIDSSRSTRGPFPDDARVWFAWTSGLRESPVLTVDESSLIPGYYPISLEESRGYVEAWGANAAHDVGGEHYLPFLGAPNGDNYAFVWSPDGYTGIAGFLVGESVEIEFTSLEQMLSYVLECYAEGAFYVDSAGLLSMNADLCDAILEQIQD